MLSTVENRLNSFGGTAHARTHSDAHEIAIVASNSLTHDARNRRQEREADGTGPEGLEGPDEIIDRARDALAGLGDIGELVQAEAAKIGVKSTFNAAAVRGLAAGNAADRTATATEETAKNTKRLVQAATTGGLTFA